MSYDSSKANLGSGIWLDQVQKLIKFVIMDIIVLQGLSNTGKTTTINLTYDIVLQNGGVSMNRKPLGGDPNDFWDIVSYQNSKVAFFSIGDNSTELAKAVHNFNKMGYDKMICSLSNGIPKKRANNALNLHNTTRINKTVTPNTSLQNQTNITDAQTIFNLI